MEDFNDMKIMWQNMNDRLSSLERENKKLMYKVIHDKYHTTKEKLEKKYCAFIFVGSITIVFITLFLIGDPLVNDRYRIPTMIYWIIFFLMEISFDVYLLLQIRKIDIYTATISEVSHSASRNWRLHKIGIIIGLPMAIGAAILFALALNANIFIIYGMITGGVIGLSIGLYQLFKFKTYYKLLQIEDD